MRKSILVPSIIVLLLTLFLMILTTFLCPIKYFKTIKKYSNMYNLEPSLICSVINVESRYNPKSVSKAGAIGLMQLLPTTATDIATNLNISNYDLYDIDTNIYFGCYYLRYLFDLYDGDQKMTLVAYNAGLGTLNTWLIKDPNLENIPYKETENYLKKINFNEKIYKIKL